MSQPFNGIAVDKTKMDRILEKRGLSYSDVAREMGRSPKYLSNKVRNPGYITLPDAKFLKVMYGITEDEYAPDPKPETKIDMDNLTIGAMDMGIMGSDDNELEPYTLKVEIDYDKLHNVIFDAVYQAVKKAWAE